MRVEKAGQEDLPRIAAMHVDPTAVADPRGLASGRGACRLYLDKVRLFHACEPGGILVARDGERIAGFLIVTASVARFKRYALRSGAALRIALRAALGMYGLDGAILRKIAVLPFTIFGGRIRRGGTSPGMLPDAKVWAVVTAREHRRMGVASALLEAGEAYLRSLGVPSVGITVGIGNEPAIGAYRKAGYRAIGEVLESTGPSLYMEKGLRKAPAPAPVDVSI